jgi:hypothetical protein
MRPPLSVVDQACAPVLDHLARQGLVAPAHRAALLRLLLGDLGDLGEAGAMPLPPASQSGLNPDGLPLQLCVSARPGGSVHVLIGDPAAHVAHAGQRQQAAVGCARELLRRCGVDAMAPAVETTLAGMLPHDAAGQAACRMGALWLAVGVEQPAFALYAGAAWPGDTAASWRRISRWLATMLDEPAPALVAALRLRDLARPESVCIDGTDPSAARVKIYFRLTRTVAHGALAVLALDDERVHAFVEDAIGARELPLSALVFSLSFSLATGAWHDAKLDICAHCVRRPRAAWQGVLQRAQRSMGVDTSAAMAMLDAPGLELACIGIGLDRRGQPRVNAYGKPVHPTGR